MSIDELHEYIYVPYGRRLRAQPKGEAVPLATASWAEPEGLAAAGMGNLNPAPGCFVG
jgi:hypothetical protein